VEQVFDLGLPATLAQMVPVRSSRGRLISSALGWEPVLARGCVFAEEHP